MILIERYTAAATFGWEFHGLCCRATILVEGSTDCAGE